jgi:hypothetical protein
MADNFHIYLKKQLLEYIESERKKGIPLETIEKALLNAGHQKNIIDEVFFELKKEEAGKTLPKSKDPVENDISSMLKKGFSQFMAQAKTGKEIKEAQKDVEKQESETIVEEAIEEAEVIEEKTMLEGVAFFIYLLVLGIIIMFTAGSTSSEITSVALGFTPVIINAFVSFMALKFADNVPLYIFIPLGIVSVFYALGKFAGLALFQNMDIEALSVVNFLLAFAFNILIVYVRFLKPKHMKKKIIRKGNKGGSGQQVINSSNQNAERKEIEELKKEFNI